MQDTPSFASFTIQYLELLLWIIVERRFQLCSPKLMKLLIRIPNIILGAFDDHGNYDGDAKCDYNQDE